MKPSPSPPGAPLAGLAAGDWAEHGNCRSDPDLFTSYGNHDRERATSRALSLCGTCRVLAPCADYAAGHTWSGVVVAGWVAPAGVRTRYPGLGTLVDRAGADG